MVDANIEERDLWRKVVLQAVIDATTPFDHLRSKHNRQRAEQDQRSARAWFHTGSEDFREVCSFAELDHNHIRSTALRLMKESDEKSARPLKLKSNDRRVTSDARGRKPTTLTLNGVSKTVAEWASIAGVAYATFSHRLWRGIPLEEALTMGRRGISSPVKAKRQAGGGSELSPVG